ncbi:MAG: c-type cytochrome [Thermoleophilia bacterium]
MNKGQREYYKKDYAAAKAAGKPFFPYAIYKDLLIATLAIGFVIVLAVWQRVEIGEPVNPASTDFVPRPEWYFLFLFELLKIFKGQNALMPVIMATFIVPNILMLLLILVPFIDNGPERRIQRRPIALITAGVVVFFLAWLTNKGAHADAGGSTLQLSGIEGDAKAEAGMQLWLENCTTCHMIKDVGAPGPGPNLTVEGTKDTLKVANAKEFLTNPPPGMIPFATFTDEQYEEIGTFIEGLGVKYK